MQKSYLHKDCHSPVSWGVEPAAASPSGLPYRELEGYPLSDLARPKIIVRQTGENNIIFADWDSLNIIHDVMIEVMGSNNVIYLGSRTYIMKLRLVIQGHNNVLGFGERSHFGGNRMQISGSNCAIICGNGFGIQSNTMLLAKENGCRITVGDDCMFSTDIAIRTSDNHPVFDMKTKERVNMGQDVNIGSRVWIGENAKILKGVTLANDVIVGAASVVTRNAPANTVVAGAPAKVVKTGVFWYRHFALMEDYDPYNPTPWPYPA